MDSAWTPPYVTVKPDISCYRITENDRFMILSTDGLFQDLHSAEIVQYVGAVLDGNMDLKERNISTLLLRKALLAAAQHFDGRLQSEELNLTAILNMNPRLRRSVHDDLTVVTMFFDHTQKTTECSDSEKNDGQEAKVPPTLSRLLARNEVSKL